MPESPRIATCHSAWTTRIDSRAMTVVGHGKRRGTNLH